MPFRTYSKMSQIMPATMPPRMTRPVSILLMVVPPRFPRGGTTMSKIDTGRVILGGIVAGIICDIFEYVLNGIVLRDQWNTISTSHNLPMIGMNEIVIFNILGLVTGIAAVWAYAAMRPRFGAGPMTAVYAALLIWIVGYVIPNVFQTVS